MKEVKTGSLRKWLIAAIVLIVILAGLAVYRWVNLVERSTEAAARSMGPVQVTAKELAMAFDEDPIAADLKYDNRMITVTGSFRGVTVGPAGDPSISIGEDPIFTVVGLFDKIVADELAALREGQTIRITCTGVLPGATGPSLSDCDVLEGR